jgi:hypothetical protein
MQVPSAIRRRFQLTPAEVADVEAALRGARALNGLGREAFRAYLEIRIPGSVATLDAAEARLARHDEVAGTLPYMPPEEVRGLSARGLALAAETRLEPRPCRFVPLR